MPTGYTAYIENGEISTGKEFLMLCSRAFGIAMDIRDEPLSVSTPLTFEPDNYYKEKYARAITELESAKSLTKEEALNNMKGEFSSRAAKAKRMLSHYEDLKAKYEKVLSEVNNWTPPTIEHDGIKKFAIKQIDMCANNFDRYIQDYRNTLAKKFIASDDDIMIYINEQIESAQRYVSYAKEAWDKEVENARSKTVFMKKFIDSLESL